MFKVLAVVVPRVDFVVRYFYPLRCERRGMADFWYMVMSNRFSWDGVGLMG